MAQVNTVRGPIDTSDLGFTLMHEHVIITTEGVPETWPSLFDEEHRVKQAVEKLKKAYDAGVRTIVDLTVHGLGRNIPRLQRIASQTEVNIIVATGLYTYDELPHHFQNNPGLPKELARDEDYMARLFVGDIKEGIGDTGVKAAILKVATDEKGVTPGVEQALRAVARAHRQTGAPISTHTHAASEQGKNQQKIFEQEGVDLSRVVIGHSGDSTDPDYLTGLIERGSYIGMDRFGIEAAPYSNFDQRVDIVVKLCELGHAKRMVLSHDCASHMDWFAEEALQQVVPRWHWQHISQDVIPALRERGVSDEQIEQMTVGNPRAIFDKQGSY
ncbi:MAG: phosphotriesterase-related protein [Dehalococcoidia bacterium]